jgi:hypothetical protein
MIAPIRFDERVNALLAGFAVAIVPYAFTLLMFKDVPDTTRDIVMILVGVMAANASTAIQTRFGSTPGSQRKDETIATMAKTQAAVTPTLDTVTTVTTKTEETPK